MLHIRRVFSSIDFTLSNPLKLTTGLYELHVSTNVQIIASGCTFLAAKVEESFRNLEDIARFYYTAIGVQAIDDIKVSHFGFVNCNWKEIKMKILLAERVILNVLSFDLLVEQPYNAIITISSELESTKN